MLLPEEILREILTFIPDQLSVGEVCKKFYKISCSLSSYRLEIREDYEADEEVTIESIYQNVLSSCRKIESVRISLCDISATYHLRKIIQHIGEDVKEVTFFEMQMCMKSFGLLNSMPNLEKLEFVNTRMDVKLKVPRNFKLELHQLRECNVKNEISSQLSLEIFDRLPKNVLRKLQLWGIESPGQNFSNQQSLEKVQMLTESDYHVVDLKKLKLKSLKFRSDQNDCVKQLEGQEELTELSIYHKIVQKDLDFICSELKMLKTLMIFGGDWENLDFSNLQNLTGLKELLLRTHHSVDPIKTIRSKTLEELVVDFVDEETVLQVSVNCPNLRGFRFYSDNQAFLVNQITNLFPKIDSLYYADQFKVSKRWENEKVTRLKIHSTSNNKSMLSVARSFKNLKSLMINCLMKPTTLKSLLAHHPNLESICIYSEEKNIKVVKKYCKNVKSIHVFGSENADIKTWKESFKDQFYTKTAKEKYLEETHNHCLMKKGKGGIESYCNACEFYL